MLARMKKGAKKNQRKPGFIKVLEQFSKCFVFFVLFYLFSHKGHRKKIVVFFYLITSCNKFIIVSITF